MKKEKTKLPEWITKQLPWYTLLRYRFFPPKYGWILTKPNSKGFTDINTKHMTAQQMFSFLTSYIEEAGYTWVYDGEHIKIFIKEMST